jgi:hypothetical protein
MVMTIVYLGKLLEMEHKVQQDHKEHKER